MIALANITALRNITELAKIIAQENIPALAAAHMPLAHDDDDLRGRDSGQALTVKPQLRL